MKTNSENPYSSIWENFRTNKDKEYLSFLLLFLIVGKICKDCLEWLGEVMCAKKNPCQVLCVLLLPMAMGSLEIRVRESLNPINPRNLLVSSTQGQNNMQLWWIGNETTLQI